ncbi:hypothetical protein HMPREF1022_00111 [Desulfovibrio sp. 6_1_46AFAA]|uniref:hypothetical protein n=1 Tax=Desulfovibrio sp. 6_1_46AFAA TaxID=665942 RepID=UPI0002236D7E|nr:hypothetical protein [Desulfovibrio sp. 6_1_46AFAA]EGW49598.1 hypothetical protein HMPREF1022_00111 [Desulfovibrio sp. 6_1_46AFAA]
MIKTDLSTEALLARREVAEKAAKRMPFEVARIVLCMGEEEREGNHKDEDDFLTSNDPEKVIATIDELLRLRKENERMQSMIAALARKVANLTREWAKAGNVDNSAEYWVSWARHDAKAARRAVEE